MSDHPEWLKALLNEIEPAEFESTVSKNIENIVSSRVPITERDSCGGSNCNSGCKCPVFRGGSEIVCTAETAGEWGGTYAGALVS